VPTIQFVAVNGFWFNEAIQPLLITNGPAGQVWLAMVPPDPPPAVALPTLGDFFIHRYRTGQPAFQRSAVPAIVALSHRHRTGRRNERYRRPVVVAAAGVGTVLVQETDNRRVNGTRRLSWPGFL